MLQARDRAKLRLRKQAIDIQQDEQSTREPVCVEVLDLLLGDGMLHRVERILHQDGNVSGSALSWWEQEIALLQQRRIGNEGVMQQVGGLEQQQQQQQQQQLPRAEEADPGTQAACQRTAKTCQSLLPQQQQQQHPPTMSQIVCSGALVHPGAAAAASLGSAPSPRALHSSGTPNGLLEAATPAAPAPAPAQGTAKASSTAKEGSSKLPGTPTPASPAAPAPQASPPSGPPPAAAAAAAAAAEAVSRAALVDPNPSTADGAAAAALSQPQLQLLLDPTLAKAVLPHDCSTPDYLVRLKHYLARCEPTELSMEEPCTQPSSVHTWLLVGLKLEVCWLSLYPAGCWTKVARCRPVRGLKRQSFGAVCCEGVRGHPCRTAFSLSIQTV